ncbi:TerB N-terminal domain-containing protein [Stappia sp. ES.058]|uniref:TerB N-terminal domain-containing protein n=1 Tax=Stappia sp. ES.058 TaxID=1881061 RepID=UPI000B814E5A|nr:TerB N-terminal domain-containing protein [Stappia sp. ES.058]
MPADPISNGWHPRATIPMPLSGTSFSIFMASSDVFFVDEASRDNDAIIDEVRRLISIYGRNGSFRNYATQFLEFASPLSGNLRTRPEIDAEASHGFEFPLPARLYLGARLADGQVLDAEDCLLWFVSLPETRLRTPAKRCFDLFQTLWKIRFQERHPEGLKVRTPKRTLKNTGYRAASGTFTATLTGATAIPDITSLTSPLKGFAAIAETCTSDLESYSRFVGKRPEDAQSTEAAVLLPKAFLSCDDDNPLKALSQKISETFAGRPTGKIALAELCEKVGLGAPGEGKVPPPSSTSWAPRSTGSTSAMNPTVATVRFRLPPMVRSFSSGPPMRRLWIRIARSSTRRGPSWKSMLWPLGPTASWMRANLRPCSRK